MNNNLKKISIDERETLKKSHSVKSNTILTFISLFGSIGFSSFWIFISMILNNQNISIYLLPISILILIISVFFMIKFKR